MASLLARLWHLQRGAGRRRREGAAGLHVPPILIVSVTMRCNLACPGCYSRDHPRASELTEEELDRLFTQAEELGVAFVVLTGGEPLLRPELRNLLARRRRLLFLLFTNALLLDEAWLEALRRLHHVVPILSVEGNQAETDARRGAGVHAAVLEGMERLRRQGTFFGFSCMVTRRNLSRLCREDFLDALIARGCRLGFLVGYVPTARDGDARLVPSAAEQADFRVQMRGFQRRKRIILIQMPDDEYEIAGTCMAAGRGFLHINAQGGVEPCPFSHWSAESVRDLSLRQALRSPWLAVLRARTDLYARPLQGCALYEHRETVARLATEHGARPTRRVERRPAAMAPRLALGPDAPEVVE